MSMAEPRMYAVFGNGHGFYVMALDPIDAVRVVRERCDTSMTKPLVAEADFIDGVLQVRNNPVFVTEG